MDNREDIIDMEVHYESRWQKFKHKAWTRKEKAKNWIKEDPRRALALGSIAVVGGKKFTDFVKSLRPTQSELDRRWQECHVYDRSLGFHYELKRPMTGSEAIEFSQRKANGERTGDILRSMRLLKR